MNEFNIKEHRKKIGLSQARLAELTGISQHLISAHELGKKNLNQEMFAKVETALTDLEKLDPVLNRKKRYRSHSYEVKKRDSRREALHQPTPKNVEYVRLINERPHKSDTSPTALCLFSGVGGFSLGFSCSGFDVKGFVEIDRKLSDIYKTNFPEVPQLGEDITLLSDDEIRSFLREVGDIDVVVGGPPCQGFSLSGKRDIADPRNVLFLDYIRVVKVVRPKIAVMENVRLLTSMKNAEGHLVKDVIYDEFRAAGYKVAIYEVNAKDYGVPQHRQRVIFMAVREDLHKEPSMPAPTHGGSGDMFTDLKPYLTLADACSDLPYIESGEKSADALHKAVAHPDHVIEWLWDVPEGASAHDNEDEDKRPPSGYNTTYKRQIWGEPAATVQTTFGMISGCRNVHPIATRSLTIREAARIQSFPDWYSFTGNAGTIRTGIGNAVPPLFARCIAKHLRTHFLDLVEVSSL